MNFLNVLLQVAADTGVPQSGWEKYQGIFMILAIVAIFYFLIIRPQQQRQKKLQTAREQMKVGDKVITSGGIYGKIKEIDDSTMLIEVADGVRIRVDKASVFSSSMEAQQK